MNSNIETNISDQNSARQKQIERMLADKFVCQVLGVTLIEANIGYAKAELEILPEYMNGVGICQGGVLFSLADYVISAASNYADDSVVSLEVTISYCKAVSSGKLFAEAHERCRTRSTALGDAVIKDEQGRTIALARARGFILSHKKDS